MLFISLLLVYIHASPLLMHHAASFLYSIIFSPLSRTYISTFLCHPVFFPLFFPSPLYSVTLDVLNEPFKE